MPEEIDKTKYEGAVGRTVDTIDKEIKKYELISDVKEKTSIINRMN